MALGGLHLGGKISDRCSPREKGLVWLTVSEISMPVACTEGGLEIEWLPHRGREGQKVTRKDEQEQL